MYFSVFKHGDIDFKQAGRRNCFMGILLNLFPIGC